MIQDAQTIFVTRVFYSSLKDKTELESIIKGKVKRLITIENKLYCLSGGVGKGDGKGWQSMNAYEAMVLSDYNGEKQPLSYAEQFREIDAGNRERSYDGLLIECKGKKYVLTGPEKTILPEPKIIEDKENKETSIRYSDEELQEFKILLDEKLSIADKELAHLRDKIAEITGSESYNAKGNNPELEQMIGLRDRQATYITKLQEALKRIGDKTYGICAVTGKLIDKARLRAVPHATLSIEAKKGPAAPPPIEMPAPEQKTEETTHVETPQVNTTDELAPQVRKCRKCGCTDEDCSQCIAKTGQACHWVAEDLCSACVEPEQAQTNTEEEFDIDWITQEVYFFRVLYPMLDGIDIKMKIMRKNGKLNVELIPQTATVLKPIVITGTAEEMDEGFFNVIHKPVTDAKGLKFDVRSYNKSVLESKAKKTEPSKPATKKPDEKKPVSRKAAPKKKSPPKPLEKKSTVKKEVKKPAPAKKPAVKKPEPKIIKPVAPDMFAGL